ncbi:50S ribosomal protein L35 [Thermodesulfobium narugense DSM 14796]|uniref:Large ribosomal subunit protein bL35 n=2 Tax=Thermodesulfobium TaxID=227388 RepID=M1E515_9BACT|nr:MULTISPECIES: 50S ribosomal protein L35 [Thermodesulfobium]AEE13931.1 50S ribosomal protein L35 [Thermodesulfobium narugense DSM 14796]AWB09660.1 LSU ribosomal protein L35P [Thermodesulfobium acidiphilum]
MPKMKTCRAAAKRFRVTGSGKIIRRQQNRSHLLFHKSPKRKRRLAKTLVVSSSDLPRLMSQLPYHSVN